MKHLLLLIVLLPSSHTFAPTISFLKNVHSFATVKQTCIKSTNNENDPEESMESAFKSLNELSSLDDDTPFDREKMKRLVSENASKSGDKILEINMEGVDEQETEILPEKEAKLYSEMLSDLEQEGGEEKMYNEVLGELSGGKNIVTPKEDSVEKILLEEETLYEDVDGISEERKADFMEAAIKEAVEMATKGAGEGGENVGNVNDRINDDEEMKKEIEALFESANKKLLDAVEDIRRDQRIQSEKLAEARSLKMKDDEQRLEEAQKSISRLVENVNKEKLEVVAAMKDLEAAKKKLDNDPISQVSTLKSGGLVKQSTLVLTFLFLVRSLTDLVSGQGIEGVLIQLGLALVFGILFYIL